MPDQISGLVDIEHLTQVRTEADLIILSFKSQTLKRQNHLNNVWGDKNWLNVPGPFYTGLTDNCYTGIPAAPYSVMIDLEGREFVYRQPRLYIEVHNLLTAAEMDPFEGYGWDGNHHWTLSLIREWWQRRDEFIAQLSQIKDKVNSVIAHHSDERNYYGSSVIYSKEDFLIDGLRHRIAISQCESFWREGLESYLRLYAFFIDTGKLPNESDTLPDL
jgi:hypothetical protein